LATKPRRTQKEEKDGPERERSRKKQQEKGKHVVDSKCRKETSRAVVQATVGAVEKNSD